MGDWGFSHLLRADKRAMSSTKRIFPVVALVALAAMAACSRGPARLYVVSLDLKEKPRLVDSRAGIAAPCFQEDASSLLYQAGSSPNRVIFRATLDGSPPSPWLRTKSDLSQPVLAGDVIAVTSWTKGEGNRVLLATTKGKILRTVEPAKGSPLTDGYAPVFFPHGARLALVSHRAGGSHGIGLFDRSDGSLFFVTQGDASFDQPRIASEPGEIFALRRDGGSVSIVRLPGEGGPPIVVKGGITFADVIFDVSPDGSRVVYSDMRGLFEVDTRSGAERLLSAQGSNLSYATELCPRYSPSGDAIVFVSRTKGGSRLIRLDRRGNRRIIATEQGFIHDPAFSPDGKKIAYVVSGH